MAQRITPQVQFVVKKTDNAMLMRALDQVDKNVKWDAMKGPLRKWGQLCRKVMKRKAPAAKAEYNRYREEGKNTPRNGAGTGTIVAVEPGGALKKSMGYRIRRYRRGRIIWMAVGGQRPAKGQYFPAGWRGHFMERGAFNKFHKRKLGAFYYREQAYALTYQQGVEAIEQGALAAIRAAGGGG